MSTNSTSGEVFGSKLLNGFIIVGALVLSLAAFWSTAPSSQPGSVQATGQQTEQVAQKPSHAKAFPG
jgi:hypothetical protein